MSLRVYSMESFMKVAERGNLYVLLPRQVVLKLRNVYITASSTTESCVKLRNVYDITTSLYRGKLFQSCGMCISLRTHRKEGCLKVADVYIAVDAKQGRL